MIKHVLLLTFRRIKRLNSTLLINIIGLSTGLACVFLIYLWVADERAVDKFHQKGKRLFQVMERSEDKGNILVHEGTQYPLAAAMMRDLPEVEAAAPVFYDKGGFSLRLSTPAKSLKANCVFSGKEFLNVFSFKLLAGNQAKALTNKNDGIISKTVAENLFGSVSNAVGKQVEWEILGIKKLFVVSGVLENIPHNSSLQFDLVLNSEAFFELAPSLKEWFNEPFSTYLVLKEGADPDKFNARISKYLNNYINQTIFRLFIRSFPDTYLHDKYENGVQTGGRIEYVRMFSVIGVLILFIACINFMNLATARASRRMKEIGIKKTVGASKAGLVIQFLSEAMILVGISVLISAVMVYFLLPEFNQITGKQLQVEFKPQTIYIIILTVVITGLVSGSYPAFYLADIKPVSVLKGKLKGSLSELVARRVLVIFQFVISLILIVSVLVIYRQMQYIQSKNLGYDKANIIQFSIDGTINRNLESFIGELSKVPGVTKASATQSSVVQNSISSATYGINWPGKSDEDLTQFVVISSHYDLIETLGIQLAAGRTFSKKFGSDESSLIFNEAAIKVMGLEDPIGKKVRMWGQDMVIQGVVKDFHVLSLHEAIQPLVFRCKPQETNTIIARITPGQDKETLSRIANFYKEINPGYEFDYKFLDDSYQALYVSEQRIAVLTLYFAGLAIFISCMGLFGLATFNAEVRTKEIGIRKTLGASVNGILVMLSKDFVALVLIAILIAFPISWWVMNRWLSGFVYRVDVQWWMFVLAGCAAIAVSVITVSLQALKAATANPVNSLRSE